MTELSMEFEN